MVNGIERVQHGTPVNEDGDAVHYTVAADKNIMPGETPGSMLIDFDKKLRKALADSKFEGTLAKYFLIMNSTFI
jgi:hypothetical protein